MASSDIEWTDYTWNFSRGCWPVSPGCTNCYAARQAARFSGPGGAYEGLVKLGAKGTPPKWTGKGRFVPEKLAEPLYTKTPMKIFVDSMSDLFFEEFTDEQVATAFGVMALAAQHTYQVLTKRPERMRDFFAQFTVERCIDVMARSQYGHLIPGGKRWNRPARKEWCDIENFPLPWIWLGTSVEDQERAQRIPALLATPAAVRFVSIEPLLGPIDFVKASPNSRSLLEDLDWVIIGAESGPRRRVCDPQWIRDIVEQCVAAKVPVFLKQAFGGGGVGLGTSADGVANTGSLISLPYLDGKQYAQFPQERS